MRRRSRKKFSTASVLREKKRALARKQLYLALKKICKISSFSDLLSLKEKGLADLCEVSHILWNLKNDPFINPRLLKENESSYDSSFGFLFSCPLAYRDWQGGSLSFISNQKFTAGKRLTLTKITYALAATLYFLRRTIQLENLKQQWNVAFDSFHRALCIADENYKILRFNHSFSRLLNRQKNELRGRNVLKLLQLDQSKAETKEFLLSHAVNTQQLEIRQSPLRLNEDHFILLMASDVTKEHHLEEELSRRARETELGFIRGSIAHELNNPLSGIKTLLHIIEEDKNRSDNPPSEDIISEITLAVNRCQSLIKTLLESPHENNTLEFQKSASI